MGFSLITIMADRSVTPISNFIAAITGIGSGGWAWVSQHYEFLIPSVISLCVLIVSWYYQRQHNRRNNEKHNLEMELLAIKLKKG